MNLSRRTSSIDAGASNKEKFRHFDYAISLGGNFRATWNLRRYFDFGTAFPFDWWITPWRALNELLLDFDVDRIYNRDLLEEVTGKNDTITGIRHRELGIFLQHEFPRDWDLPGNPVRANWHERLDQPKQRTRFLLDRLLSVNTRGTQILFLRNALHPVVEGGTLLPAAETAERLRAMFSLADIHLLLVNCPTRVNDANVGHLDFKDAAAEWRGDWSAWRRALSSTGMRLKNPTLKAFDIKADPNTETERSPT